MSKTTVVHVWRKPYDIKIDRTTEWGNPFRMRNDTLAERERVTEEYRRWIVKQPHLMARLHTLRGKTLGCWCAPRPCHGDVLAELADALP